MARGLHKSALEFSDYLNEEMASMVARGQWMVLPYSDVRHFAALCLSPIGVVPQNERRPRTIVDYSHSNVNQETV
jgi:hypothetical protein